MNVERKQSAAGSNSNALWQDPDTSVKAGLLLADRIKFYVDQVGLIKPFNDQHLAPASYDLTLGREYWSSGFVEEDGRAKRLLGTGKDLIIPPNSIVFVSTAEVLNLPFYLVAHFNLRLKLLHEGLLVGAGPQIDPGFSGRLSCPLHNISSEKIALTCGERFAVIEFEKTTPFGQDEKWPHGVTEKEVRQKGEANLIRGLAGNPCPTFPQRSLGREPVKGYLPPGKIVSSSVQGIQKAMTALEAGVETALNNFNLRLTTVNALAYLAIVAVAISTGTYFWGAVNWRVHADDVAHQALDQTKRLEQENNRLDSQVRNLSDKVSALSVALSVMQDNERARNKLKPRVPQ